MAITIIFKEKISVGEYIGKIDPYALLMGM